MDFVRTTPPRPVEVAEVFPELAPLARPAIRLHPRPGSPTVGDSSVGGPLLWPAGEPWPLCQDSHLHIDSGFRQSPEEVRLERRLRARRHPDSGGVEPTPEEVALRERAAARLAARRALAPQPAECPVPLLPVAQLYVRDVPLLRPPGDADVLQVLWCPYDHDPDPKPATALFWRSAAEVVDVLDAPPEPYEVNGEGYLPEPCLLAPEAITEYPDSLDLAPEVRELVADRGRWQAAGVELDGSCADYPVEFYDALLAHAPGWKAGGWPPWGRTDAYPWDCDVCETTMVPLLTIASFEWDGDEGRGWAPYEDRAAAYGDYYAARRPDQPTAVEVGSTDNMQIYVCPASPAHPHIDLIQ
ncbi:hypothetical protein ABZ990_07845 [Streptomyces sp. NPDC046203]|uniref:hypothetical protein n=1 Tax=Streptomyces sp. NPDC046203 TaxID=3154602 RepID=UPI0034065542